MATITSLAFVNNIANREPLYFSLSTYILPIKVIIILFETIARVNARSLIHAKIYKHICDPVYN